MASGSMPIFDINICGLNGNGIFHTATKQTLGSSSLYFSLLLKGMKFPNFETYRKLADGFITRLSVNVTRVKVT